MANTKLSQRIKYAMEHLSHKQYISLLARPNWRRIQRMDMNTVASPFSTRRPALKARSSKRIKVMARPKHVNKKYDPTRAPLPYPKIQPKTLEATTTRRVNDLALPSKRLLLANLRFPTSGNVAETLWKLSNSRYKRYRFFCNARQQREMRKKHKIMAKLRRAIKPDEWDQHLEVLERLAAPKVPPKPRYPDRKQKWRPVNMRRIDELSSPVGREVPDVRDPFMVPPSALTYNISERLNQISAPKGSSDTEPPKIPGEVSPAALTGVASPRTIILAKPVERPAGIETALREDAFTVSPIALKAKCSKRLKQLARPKTYRR